MSSGSLTVQTMTCKPRFRASRRSAGSDVPGSRATTPIRPVWQSPGAALPGCRQGHGRRVQGDLPGRPRSRLSNQVCSTVRKLRLISGACSAARARLPPIEGLNGHPFAQPGRVDLGDQRCHQGSRIGRRLGFKGRDLDLQIVVHPATGQGLAALQHVGKRGDGHAVASGLIGKALPVPWPRDEDGRHRSVEAPPG